MSMGYAILPRSYEHNLPADWEVIGVGGERPHPIILVQGPGLPGALIGDPPRFDSLEQLQAAMRKSAEAR